jgi:hypothetical protein
MIDEFLKEQ